MSVILLSLFACAAAPGPIPAPTPNLPRTALPAVLPGPDPSREVLAAIVARFAASRAAPTGEPPLGDTIPPAAGPPPLPGSVPPPPGIGSPPR